MQIVKAQFAEAKDKFLKYNLNIYTMAIQNNNVRDSKYQNTIFGVLLKNHVGKK